MSRFELKLNGVDVSHMLNKWGAVYTPIKVRGPNTGISQGGLEIEDVLRIKDSFAFQGNSVQEAEYLKLSQICAQPFATAVYKCPRTGETVPKMVRLELGGASIAHMGERVWYSGWTLTMEER